MKPAKLTETKSTIRFNAKLFRPKAKEKIGSGTLLTLPKNASAKLPSRGITMIEGTINGLPFRANLTSDNKGNRWLKITESMYSISDIDTEETVTMEITRIGEEIETRVPIDLRKALATTPKAQSLWANITPIARRDWIFWIISGKKLETRKIRIDKACAMLASGKRRVCCFGGVNWLMKNS